MLIAPYAGAAGRGGPMMTRIPMVEDSSDISQYVVSPTGQQILDTFDHYMVYETATPPNDWDAGFVLNVDGYLTNTQNQGARNYLLAPSDFGARYQFTSISSSNTDDDWLGLVLGYKEDTTSKYILALDFNLQATAGPALELRAETFPVAGMPGDHIVTTVNPQVQVLFNYTNYPARNGSSLSGWQEVPWNTGIYVKTDFDGNTLSLVTSAPGGSASDQYVVQTLSGNALPTWAQGFMPRTGLFCASQVGGLWKDYTTIGIGQIFVTSTGTMWAPNTDVPPVYTDTGVGLDSIILRGRYGGNALQTGNLTYYRQPSDGQTVQVPGYPF